MPDRSGFPSPLRGTGADRFGLPSGVRGIPGVLKSSHCAARGVDSRNMTVVTAAAAQKSFTFIGSLLYRVHAADGRRHTDVGRGSNTGYPYPPGRRICGLRMQVKLVAKNIGNTRGSQRQLEHLNRAFLLTAASTNQQIAGCHNLLSSRARNASTVAVANICERALKKAILHRKNSLFYK